MTKRERDQLVSRHFAWAQKRARRFSARTPNTDADDIESAAMAGLVRAGVNYNPDTGNVFATYAGAVVDDYMKKEVQRGWTRQNRFDDGARLDGDDDQCDDDQRYDALTRAAMVPHHPDHAEDVLSAMDGRETLADWLDRVTDPRHQEALLRRLKGETVYEIADRFDVHETTVRRWLWDAGKIGPESMSREST